MPIQAALDAVIQPQLLSESSFYRAWSEGTLPVEALRAYARDYGVFISQLPKAWETLEDEHTAEEEVEHLELWEKFAETLGTKVDTDAAAKSPKAVVDLLSSADSAFSDPLSALGWLYAFESQQPETSVSKLEGLRAHYSLDTAAEPYFEAHSANHHEAEKLRERIGKLSAADQKVVIEACRQGAAKLRGALDGLHDEYCGPCDEPKAANS